MHDQFPVILVVVGAPLVVALVWLIGTHNVLVRLRNACRESWSCVDTELKRRYDLIPNLVETVKGYARHEQDTFTRVVEARSHAIGSRGSPQSQAQDEKPLVSSLRRLLVVAEKYPDLKASGNFLELQAELSNTEDRLQAARRFYNANVRDLNNRVEVFPSNLVAGVFSFQKEEFFEVENVGERAAPGVKM